jgi:RNA polymerase sigma-70 factor (ECF subfamily)
MGCRTIPEIDGTCTGACAEPGERPSGSAIADRLNDSQLLAQFVACGDAAAFEALVQRHGPVVLGVCRRLLGDLHEAEDAFQATFLVLMRRAASISWPDRLGNWLYGVAYRTACKARVRAAHRRANERRAALPEARETTAAAVDHRDLRSAIEAGLSRLPEKYRAPLVLCYLQGKTNQQAAEQLGWPIGSMSRRLARARELFRGLQRLSVYGAS